MHVFVDGQEENSLAEGPRKTKLMAYFETNMIDPSARNILYPDFPQYYTWIQARKAWQKRKKGTKIGRIPMISLNAHQAELFFLRLLLHNKAGATSFDDLRTVDGVLCDSFQETCMKLGLLERDDELDQVEYKL